MDKVRLAIVGCGTISQLNAPGYLAHENCEVVALCDPAPERAEGRAREWGISPRIHTDYADVLNDSDVDAVELLTPTPLHPEQVIAGLDAGKHVSCQKPARWNPRRDARHSRRRKQGQRLLQNHRELPLLPAHRQGAGANRGWNARRRIHGSDTHPARRRGSESAIPITEGAYVWRQDSERGNIGGQMYDDGWHKVADRYVVGRWRGEGVRRSSPRTDNFIQETPSVATWKYAG